MPLRILVSTSYLIVRLASAFEVHDFGGLCSDAGRQISWDKPFANAWTTSGDSAPLKVTGVPKDETIATITSTTTTTITVTPSLVISKPDINWDDTLQEKTECQRATSQNSGRLPFAFESTGAQLWSSTNGSAIFSMGSSGTGQPHIATASYTSLYFPSGQASPTSSACRLSPGQIWIIVISLAQSMRQLSRV